MHHLMGTLGHTSHQPTPSCHSHRHKPALPKPLPEAWPFDITLALGLLESRPNPQIDLDAANILRPFVVTDAFLTLTGYTREDVIGYNCRFLQSPDGLVSPGAPRRFISSASAYLLKQKVSQRCETEHTIINFKKSGEAFTNHLALVPIPWGPHGVSSRFVFGFSNVFDESLLPAASCQSSSYAPSWHACGDSAVANRHLSISSSTSGWLGQSVTALNLRGTAISQDVELMEMDPVDKPENHGGAAPNDLSNILPYLQGLANDNSTSATMSWNNMLLENMDALVQVLSVRGVIVYASASHEKLGYTGNELCGKSMNDLYHPSDVAILMKELKNAKIPDLELAMRLKHRSGQYTWFQSTGSIRGDKHRRWATLTLLPQPISRLSSRALHCVGDSSKHGVWMKLATSGLVLHLFDNPQKALGMPAEDLVGTRFQDALIRHVAARTEFETMMNTARAGGVASSTLALTSGRGHRLEACVVLHPGAVGDSRRPYYLLAHCSIVRPYAKRRKAPPPGNKKYNIATTSVTTEAAEEDNCNILEDLDAERCGPLGYEIHQLKMSNQSLRDEMEGLLKSATQPRRSKKRVGDPGCVNCHTKVAPEWRRGPGGERNLCNRCGIRWAKMRRYADSPPHNTSQQRDGNIVDTTADTDAARNSPSSSDG
ncbi:putative white collar 1 protein [Apiospora phragmitis]|uniref:White collar 1 protein n=1 Tax=Apiospora phragmitis TaxID=2905665 RepID=A0ABR1W7D8_9PEZI